MPNERPRQFGGNSRFGAPAARSGHVQPSGFATMSASPSASRATQLGLGLGRGAVGLGKSRMKRHMYGFEMRVENVLRLIKVAGKYTETPSMA